MLVLVLVLLVLVLVLVLGLGLGLVLVLGLVLLAKLRTLRPPRHAQPSQSKVHGRKQHSVQGVSLIAHVPALPAVLAVNNTLGLDQQQHGVVIRLAGVTYRRRLGGRVSIVLQ